MTSSIKRAAVVWLLVGVPVLTGLLASCSVTMATPLPVASPPPSAVSDQSDPPAGPDESLALDVRVYIERADRKVRIETGSLVNGGELFELLIRPNQPAYVYLAQASSTGSVSVLFPEAGDQLLSGNRDHRLPSDVETWYQVAGDDGEENLFLLMARAPIHDLKELLPPALPASKNRARRSVSKPPEPTPQRDDRVLDDTTRTVIRVRKVGAVAATVPRDAPGDNSILVRQLHFRRK